MTSPTTVLLVHTGAPDSAAIRRVATLAKRDGAALHSVAELLEELPGADATGPCTRLDDHRRPESTIRNAAERADRLLRSVRPLLTGHFEHRGASLWLAQETYILHFHLLRVLDLVEQVSQVFDDVRPARIQCVGPVTTLTQVVTLVAESRQIPVELHAGAGARRKLGVWSWWARRQFLPRPGLFLRLAYGLQRAREFVEGRRGSRGPAPRKQPRPEARGIGVTFIGSNRKQSDVTIQLAKYLEATGEFECRFLNIFDEKLAQHLDAQGLPVARLAEYGGERARLALGDARRRFLADAIGVFDAPQLRAQFVVGGVDVWPLTGLYLARFALVSAPHLVELAERTIAYLSEEPSDMVVTPAEWDPFSRACVVGARATGAASLSVQRGDITGFPGWADPIFSDRMAVNGPAIKKAMVEAGVDAEKLVVTGDSRLDPWVRDPSTFFRLGETRAKLGIPADRRLVAVMTNPVTLNEKASHTEEYVAGLLEAERNDDSLHFVIKLHPNESDLAFYERIRDRVGARNVTVIKELDTPQLLFDSDAVVTTISTTGEEAIFLGKPLIVVNLTNEPDFMPYVGSPAAITVRERGQLEAALSEALRDSDSRERLREGRRAYVAEHFLSDDGNSSERCADLIRSLLAAKGTLRAAGESSG